jgi:hypothetical protein
MKDLKLKNIEKLTQLREEFNKVISERIQDCEREKLIEDISSLSFSKIKAIFESVAPNLINDKEGAKLTRKYVKLMKESNDLKNACRFHKLTNDRHSFTNSDMLLSESLTLVKRAICSKICMSLQRRWVRLSLSVLGIVIFQQKN